jgi:regulatory protein
VAAVTALKVTRAPGRIAVHVDGAFLVTVSEAFVARSRLYVGLELDEAALDRLRADAAADGALAAAYRLLGHRQRSRAELRARLAQRGCDDQVIDGVLRELAADGLVDDEAFARAFVADKRTLSGWGGERIARALRETGVSDEVADRVLAASGADQADDAGGGLAALQRRGPARPPLDKARKRAYEFLLRKGFSTTVAYDATRRWAAGDGSPD